MAHSDDDVLSLLHCLCDAALDDVVWGDFLKALSKATCSLEASLFVVDPLVNRCTNCITCNLERDWVGRCDLQASGSCVWVPFGPAAPPGTSSSRTARAGEDDVQPFGLSVALGNFPETPGLTLTELWRYDGRSAYLALHRPKAAPLEGQAARTLDAVLPFLRRAFLVSYRLEVSDRRNAMLVRAVEHAIGGVVLLEAHGRIAYANPAARDILAQGDGLFADALGLHALRRSDNETLQRLVRGAIGPPADETARTGGTLVIPRPSGKPAYAAVVVPVLLERSALRSDDAVATVFLSDPVAIRETGESHIRQLYGLTPKETKLAVLLAAGSTVSRAAAALGMAEKTARIHLQGLFRKTGTRRQVDLVRVLLGSADPRRNPGRGAAEKN